MACTSVQGQDEENGTSAHRWIEWQENKKKINKEVAFYSTQYHLQVSKQFSPSLCSGDLRNTLRPVTLHLNMRGFTSSFRRTSIVDIPDFFTEVEILVVVWETILATFSIPHLRQGVLSYVLHDVRWKCGLRLPKRVFTNPFSIQEFSGKSDI